MRLDKEEEIIFFCKIEDIKKEKILSTKVSFV